MSEHILVVMALTIAALIFAVIWLAVNYGCTVYENRKLESEIKRGLHQTVLLNKSVEEDNRYLESQLRPYVRLAHKWGCCNADELTDLLKDLQDKLLNKEA